MIITIPVPCEAPSPGVKRARIARLVLLKDRTLALKPKKKTTRSSFILYRF